MPFITGTLIIDAPASALNNSGEAIPGARTDNTSSVKFIRASDGKTYPYVSAQALRYWLRNTLESHEDIEWIPSLPVYRDEKVAYTHANPINFWDDDLLGYMRAPGSDKKKRMEDPEYQKLTPLEVAKKGDKENEVTVTRVSPFRMSTLVSLAPVNITVDFGTMSRQEADAVPYEHQFYQATLQGLMSLDLGMVGKFYYRRRTGFQNLDKVRRDLAEQHGLEHLPDEKAYRFDPQERLRRVSSLLRGLGRLSGGAKQATHYTDVSPAVIILAITKGGNHPFNYLFQEKRGEIVFQEDVFAQVLDDMRDQLLSPVFIGWKPGYLPQEHQKAQSIQVEGVEIYHYSSHAACDDLAAWMAQNLATWSY